MEKQVAQKFGVAKVGWYVHGAVNTGFPDHPDIVKTNVLLPSPKKKGGGACHPTPQNLNLLHGCSQDLMRGGADRMSQEMKSSQRFQQ